MLARSGTGARYQLPAADLAGTAFAAAELSCREIGGSTQSLPFSGPRDIEEIVMASYRDLVVWQRAMDLVERLYEFSRTLPRDERFGLCSQLQRAGVSIPSNLAEGHSRRSDGAFLNHVAIAIGSQAEVETLLETCRRLELGNSKLRVRAEGVALETGKMLYGLHASLERSRANRKALVYSIVLALTGIWYLAAGR